MTAPARETVGQGEMVTWAESPDAQLGRRGLRSELFKVSHILPLEGAKGLMVPASFML